MIKKDGKIYYTLEESKKISDKNIIASADKLILDLRKKQKLISKEELYV